MKKLLLIISLLIILDSPIFSQSTDIADYINQVENGKIDEANSILKSLLKNHPTNKDVLYLDAILTADGSVAIEKFLKLPYTNKSFDYADDTLFRIFSYYYSLGIYKKAGGYLNELKKNFPNSKYIDLADRKIPNEDVFEGEVISHDSGSEKIIEDQPIISNPKFSIQAGAFLNEKNAVNLKKKFIADGNFSEVHVKDVGGSLLNIVTVGKFHDIESVNNFLKTLQSKYKLTGRVITIR